MAPQPLRQRRLILDLVVIGVAGALAAQLFALLLRGANWLFLTTLAQYVPLGLPNEGGSPQEIIGRWGLWMIPVATTLGGLIVGVIVTRLAPEAEGHGTDTAVRAFHRSDGVIRPQVPPVKLLASAITIGSGGSAGREGPIALVTAGLGSWYASLTNRSGEDRRMLMLAGMAAGLAAVFRSPIGTALFAIEVLYAGMAFESGALFATMMTSIVAYAVNGLFSGYEPLFRVPEHIELVNPLENAWFVVLGIAAGVLGAVLPALFYRVRDAFRKLKIRPEFKPALGGLLTGLIALAAPQIIGGGYGWVQAAIDGQLTGWILLGLIAAKMLSLSFTVASGGSGGVFAPSLYIGAMLGGGLASVAHLPVAPFVIVGMAAVFAGSARVPIATLIMVTEMTGGYTLLVPAALAVMMAFVVQRRLVAGWRYGRLYEAQVVGPADSPAHHSAHLKIALDLLQQRKVIDPGRVGGLDLLGLLRSGIPVELPGEQRLMIKVLKPTSPCVGQPAQANDLTAGGDATLFAIIRGEHMLGPRDDIRLEAGDRLLLLTSAAALERLAPHLDAW
ncbi:MAG TPA: chloride channel protein [Gemmatimonadales bacterium]|nr:chloride channel protein [Gemmatimonadales bacterium]